MPYFDHASHKRLWNWLQNNPGSQKDRWPGWEWNGGHIGEINSDCFACQAEKDAFEKRVSGISCFKRCPLIWDRFCFWEGICGVLFWMWDDATYATEYYVDVGNKRIWRNDRDGHEAADCVALARRIRDLHVREEYRTKE